MKKPVTISLLAISLLWATAAFAHPPASGDDQRSQNRGSDRMERPQQGSQDRADQRQRGPQDRAGQGRADQQQRPAPHQSQARADRGRDFCAELYGAQMGRLAVLEARLSLTESQHDLWEKWAGLQKDTAMKMQKACAAMKPESAPPRYVDILRGQEQQAGARLDALRASRPAATALYESLSPEQKKLFDQAMMFSGEKRGMPQMGFGMRNDPSRQHCKPEGARHHDHDGEDDHDHDHDHAHDHDHDHDHDHAHDHDHDHDAKQGSEPQRDMRGAQGHRH